MGEEGHVMLLLAGDMGSDLRVGRTFRTPQYWPLAWKYCRVLCLPQANCDHWKSVHMPSCLQGLKLACIWHLMLLSSCRLDLTAQESWASRVIPQEFCASLFDPSRVLGVNGVMLQQVWGHFCRLLKVDPNYMRSASTTSNYRFRTSRLRYPGYQGRHSGGCQGLEGPARFLSRNCNHSSQVLAWG